MYKKKHVWQGSRTWAAATPLASCWRGFRLLVVVGFNSDFGRLHFRFFWVFLKEKKTFWPVTQCPRRWAGSVFWSPVRIKSVCDRWRLYNYYFFKKKIRFGTEKEERERERETQPAAAELVGFSVGFGRIVCEYFAFRHGDSNDGHSFHFYFNRKMRGKKGT